MKSFSSKIGVLLAAAGSAIGLGSIWKFPYIVGKAVVAHSSSFISPVR